MKYLTVYIIIALFCFPLDSIASLDTIPNTQNIGFAKTNWNDFEVINPASQIPNIKPPEGHSTGAASVSFPIKVPDARNNFQPDLNLQYSNEGGTTWIGTGWDLTLESFTIDTRWGVPIFDSANESEIYLYNGEQMSPVVHRSIEYPRETERSFHLRQESSFDKIVRHGTSPNNYWWQVNRKNGTVVYYGGTPALGSDNAYTLKTAEGNITEWFIVMEKDVYGNTIHYQYQNSTYQGMSAVLPHYIYYNGYEDELGDYKIEFILKDKGAYLRKDIQVNCRTGREYLIVDLLEEIRVSYAEAPIRSYLFEYETGEFNKEILQAVSEYDQNGELFYSYDFEYYNDVKSEMGEYSVFNNNENWSVSKDILDVSPVSATSLAPFLEKPTILGGAKSDNFSGGLAVTVGFVGSPVSKENTVGINGGGGTSSGTGLITLVDINSDGLPDKVWKENGSLYFKENLFNNGSSTKGFSSLKKKIEGINDFSISNTISWNIGAELNLGIGAVGGFVGISHEESTTTISTYLADFNGDELVDVASNKRVYFNTVGDDGIPRFTTQSSQTESPIFTGEPLDPNLIVIDPNEQQIFEDQFPLNDIIRTWTSPVDGLIEITGTVQLESECNEDPLDAVNKDGVSVMIQKGRTNLWETEIDADDFGIKTPTNVALVPIAKGDQIYFRVHSNENGYCDKVIWDPQISYTDKDASQMDANCLPLYEYGASKDFLLSEKSTTILPVSGTVRLTGNLNFPNLSDSIRIVVNGPFAIDSILPSQTNFDQAFLFENVNVLASDEISFQVSAKTNVDWAAIDWRPRIEYTAFADGSPAFDSNGDPVLSLYPSIEFLTFPEVDVFGDMYIANTSGNLRITGQVLVEALFSGPGYLSVKKKSITDSLVVLEDLLELSSLTSGYFTYDFLVSAGDTIYTDLFYNYQSFAFNFDNARFEGDLTYFLGGNSTTVTGGVYKRDLNQDNSAGHHYRGWGQFAYNANSGRGDLPINLAMAGVDTTGLANDTLLIDENTMQEEVEGGSISSDEVFIVLRADPVRLAWQGSDPRTYLDGSCMSSSRNGLQDVDLSNPTLPGGNTITTIDLVTKTKSDAGAAGVSANAFPVGAGGGLTFASAWSISDVTDLNGDRFPDYLSETTIQYTNTRGGLSSQIINHADGIHVSGSFAYGGGVGGSYISSSSNNSSASLGRGSNKINSRQKAKNNSKLSGSRNAFKSSKSSIGFNGSITVDRDSTLNTFIDLNGDGLEDKVSKDGRVALNLGYKFASKRQWNFQGVREGNSFDIGAGAGYSYSNGSIVAGLSASRTDNYSSYGFTDFNDDALVDLIISVDPLVVRMNNGLGFGDPITILDEERVDQGYSIGESLNGAVCPCINFFIIRVCFNPSTSIGQGVSSVESSFVDIDGDGYVDFLKAQNDDGNLSVRSSRVGRTNMLKTIHTPTGGSITLDYKVAGNSYGMPFSKWVLAEYKSYDGLVGDGVDYYQTTFDYAEPKYDRHERQFYGFAIVEENDLDTNSIIVRTVKTEYHVDNFYTKGLRDKVSILNGNDDVFQVTEFEYSLKDVSSGQTLPSSIVESDVASAFPALTEKTTSIFEGLVNVNIKHINTYEYDSLGNVIVEWDIDEAGSQLRYEREYQYDFDKYLVDKVSSEKVYGADGLYRHTDYLRDSDGNNIQIVEHFEDNQQAVTDLTYDEYGNVLSKANPENYLGERLIYEYQYDSTQHQYLIYEKDSYGYESFYKYEYFYNEMIESVDLNRQTTLYEYDANGRPHTVTYPMEFNNGDAYSIRYEYFPLADVAYSVSHYFDPQHESDLLTVAFADGLQRIVQEKVQSEIFKNGQSNLQYIVSGTEYFDGLGRVVSRFLPILDDPSNAFIFKDGEDEEMPTVIAYDVLDRPIRIKDPYNGVTHFNYTIQNDLEVGKALTTITTDALDHISQNFYNVRGNILAQRYEGPQGDVWTKYQYDGFDQVLNIIDAYQNVTTYEYDLLGRRISVKVPDAGVTQLKYDKANNLIERITATIRDVVSTDGAIKYKYDKERLIQIDYPKYFQNKVQIHYGSPQDSFNRAGRIWLQEDATGGREYFFDVNGNPTKTIRTVMVNRTNVFTYVSEATYDTWGRINQMIYPDGEQVNYFYNQGGALVSMSGLKGDKEQQYIKQFGYDKFGDCIFKSYGNDIVDAYEYDLKGRLVERKTSRGNDILMSEMYEYDKVDNLVSKANQQSSSSDVGGSYNESFVYDTLYRMSEALGAWTNGEGSEGYDIFFDYDDINNVTLKSQSHTVNDALQILTSRTFDYQYEDNEQPTRPTEIGGRDAAYDKNGNLLSLSSQNVFNFKQNVFDEENRLIGHSNNGKLSRYTYDAFGKRTIKSKDSNFGVSINGAAAGFVEHVLDFKVNVSPYFTAYENEYRKHYFVDDDRFLTKIGTGIFQTTLGQGPTITAGGIDYKKRIQAYEDAIYLYYAELGVPPGPPGLLAFEGQPEINTNSLPEATIDSVIYLAPTNWPLLPPPDTMGPPGPPVFFENANLSNQTVQAGFNFSAGNIVNEVEQFYYHEDNFGSVRLSTGISGNVRQYALYFPTGELWKLSNLGIDSTSFLYKSLEFDVESGFYNLGNIYYDPITSLEQSIDPVLQNFGENTFLERTEGDFYYDYADANVFDEDPEFDAEILNAEKPDPFLQEAINGISPLTDGLADPAEILLTYGDVIDAFGGDEPSWNIKVSDIDPNNRFFEEIESLVPYLTERDYSDPKEFKALAENVLVDPRVKEFKKRIRNLFKQKQKEKKPVKQKIKRKVRFK